MAELFIGLMSGTSMDGINAALVDFTSSRPTIIATYSHKYPAASHQQLESALQLETPLNTDLTAIDTAVGETFAAVTNELLLNANVAPENIIAIGHG
jgi:anhydro-N-acetylmuramic acid kinase